MGNKETFDTLIAVGDTATMSADAAIEHIGELTDVSFDLQKLDGLRKAIKLGDELGLRKLTSAESTTLDYFHANAWAGLRHLAHTATRNEGWQWEQGEIEKELFFLRRAARSDGFKELPKDRQCQILTNLGNLFSHVGRFVEAIEQWERALAVIPSFGMARGNRGFGLSFYARNLYDSGQAICFLQEAQTDLEKALKLPLEGDAIAGFKHSLEQVNAILKRTGITERAHTAQFSLGDTKEEIQYRRWCLTNRLFLNPLNDPGPLTVAARDVLLTPPMVVKIDEGPYLQGFFNQMKQEFVSARYQFYEGVTSKDVHFSDKDVLVFDTLDYPSYSRAVENIKAAFRIAYSLFDKMAYFLNFYMKLGINDRSVYFSTFWYEKQKLQKGLRTEFQSRRNWPLRGLFWLSKDLFENRPDFVNLVEPDARELYMIRQHLEHKYLKVHEFGAPVQVSESSELPDPFLDTLAFSVGRREIERKTMRLLKLVRAGLIYLSLGVHCEEKHRAKERGECGILPMHLSTFEDDWKV